MINVSLYTLFEVISYIYIYEITFSDILFKFLLLFLIPRLVYAIFQSKPMGYGVNCYFNG